MRPRARAAVAMAPRRRARRQRRAMPMRTLPMRATTAMDRMRSTRPTVTRATRRSLRLAPQVRRRQAWIPMLRPSRHSLHRWSRSPAPRRRRRWEWWPPLRYWLHPHRSPARMRWWSRPACSAPRRPLSARARRASCRRAQPAPRRRTRRSHWRRPSWWDYCFCRTVSSRRSCASVRTHPLTARSTACRRDGHGLSPTAMIICTALDTTALEIWLSTC